MEKYKKGGYTILDLESSTIYADSVKALDSNKPIVVYDGTNAPYFADSISLSGTSIIITKGGKTITIANDNTITNVGDIQNHLYEYIITFYAEYDNDLGTTFKLKFISNKSNITIDDLISNDVKSQYTNTLLFDSANDGGVNVYAILNFKEDDKVEIMDTTNGVNDWTYSELVITKIQLF